MNAHVTPPEPAGPRSRSDGWTPERRRAFLEAIAAGINVDAACRQVGLSRASAYALRNRDSGFALGWSGAYLRARDAVADILTSRALDGQVETWTRPDGTEGRRLRYDNRLALALLARLDRLVEQPTSGRGRWRMEQPADDAARGIAHDLGGFLDLIERDEADDAAVERFVTVRICKLRQLTTDEHLTAMKRQAEEIAAGSRHDDEELDDRESQHLQPDDPQPDDEAFDDSDTAAEGFEGAAVESGDADREAPAADAGLAPIWFDPDAGEWRTRLAPPDGFDGQEGGCFGQFIYWRTLTDAERAAIADDTAPAPTPPCDAPGHEPAPGADEGDPEPPPAQPGSPDAEPNPPLLRLTPLRRRPVISIA